MAVTVDEQLLKSAYDLIAENAQIMDSKESKEKPETIMYRYQERYTVTQSTYMKFLKDNGVSADVVNKLNNLEQAWNTGCAKLASEKIKGMAHDMLKDKEFMDAAGPTKLNCTIFTSVKDGKRGVTVNAYTENRNPRATGPDDAVTLTYGSIGIRHRITKGFSSEFAEKVAHEMEHLLKGKF